MNDLISYTPTDFIMDKLLENDVGQELEIAIQVGADRAPNRLLHHCQFGFIAAKYDVVLIQDLTSLVVEMVAASKNGQSGPTQRSN